MKKSIYALLMICCLFVSFAMAEEAVAPVLNMELSQYRFTGPQEVTVTICVTNPSDQETLGPMALYYPDGRIIEEFGTPTLDAGESRTWEGTWAVTEEQLKQGRVIFAIQYVRKETDGSFSRQTQPYYAPVVWTEPKPQQVEIVLDGYLDTGYSWDWGVYDGRIIMDVACEVSASGDACYTLTGLEAGQTTICFTYDEDWYTERDPNFARYAIYYDVRVDEEMNVSILNTEFCW